MSALDGGEEEGGEDDEEQVFVGREGGSVYVSFAATPTVTDKGCEGRRRRAVMVGW